MAQKKNTAPAKGATKGKPQTIGKRSEENDARMPLGWNNYKLMLIGLGLIVLGFILMTGGGSDDPNVFNYEMFSWRRITLAPIVVLAGFGLEIYAIMKKPAKQHPD